MYVTVMIFQNGDWRIVVEQFCQNLADAKTATRRLRREWSAQRPLIRTHESPAHTDETGETSHLALMATGRITG